MQSIRFRFRLLFVCVALVLTLAACEKSNEQVLQDQIREGGAVCQKGCKTPPSGCVIKGNIGPGGKFFLLPKDPRYNLAIIDPSKGEAWFCTQSEAQSSGFSAAPP